MQRCFRIGIVRSIRGRSAGPHRLGAAWLELLLGIAAVALLFQFFPSLFYSLVHKLAGAADFRNWSPLVRFLANVAVVLGLVSIRFGSDLAEGWRGFKAQRVENKIEAKKAEKIRQTIKEREYMEQKLADRSHRTDLTQREKYGK